MEFAVFIVSLSYIASIALYPLFSFLRGLFSQKQVVPNFDLIQPFSIILSCYNEDKYIVEKVNQLAKEIKPYPESELLIFSTGSTDQTNTLLHQFEQNPQIKISYGPRISKIEALNILVPSSKNELLIFSDCRQIMKPGSIQNLIAYFVDEEIGTVSCTILDTEKKSSFFRKLYLKLALMDMRYGSSLNLYGALYAQRKSVFRPIPAHLLFDDFFVAISTLAQKKRLIQSKEAILYDVPFKEYYSEERCKRLTRGLLLFIFTEFKLLRQVPIKVRVRIYVYKYFKLLLPIVLLVCFVSFLTMLEIETAIYCLFFAIIFSVSLLLFKKTRDLILFLVRMNWNFSKAFFGYIFLNQRSKDWEKLKIARKSMKREKVNRV